MCVSVRVCLRIVSNTHSDTVFAHSKLLMQQCFYMLWQPPLHSGSACTCTCTCTGLIHKILYKLFFLKWINSLLCKWRTIFGGHPIRLKSVSTWPCWHLPAMNLLWLNKYFFIRVSFVDKIANVDLIWLCLGATASENFWCFHLISMDSQLSVDLNHGSYVLEHELRTVSLSFQRDVMQHSKSLNVRGGKN